MPVNPCFGPARGVWRRLRGLGCLLRWRGGFRLLARCARPVILSARMPGAEENVAWTALGEERGGDCWTRVRFPPSPPFKGRGELVGCAHHSVNWRSLRPLFSFAHCLAPVQGVAAYCSPPGVSRWTYSANRGIIGLVRRARRAPETSWKEHEND